MAAYPVEVEMLSRFRTPKEQEAILKRLEQGKVDIVIGTHRLLQPMWRFEPWLVIIDEEQRFGVAHKEYLKRLRTEVDVLTLTATQFPHALYGVDRGRDISTINTPPEERLRLSLMLDPTRPAWYGKLFYESWNAAGKSFLFITWCRPSWPWKSTSTSSRRRPG